MRTGHHACHDRVVFELNGRTGATVAGYVGTAKGPQVIAVGSRTQLVPVGVKPGEALPASFTTVRGVVCAGKVDGRGPYAVPPAGQPATARAKGSTWVAPAARRARPATVMVQRESTRSSTSRTAPGDSSRLSRTSGPAATRSHTPARR